MKEIEKMIEEDIKREKEMLKEAIQKKKEITEKLEKEGKRIYERGFINPEYKEVKEKYKYYLTLCACYGSKGAEERVEKDVISHYKKLQAKVEKKIGKIIKIEHLGGYDYRFEGENGECGVEVIIAGGYNIQRKHTRWIVTNGVGRYYSI